MATSKHKKHKWTFVSRFRRGAYGWKAQLPIGRIQEAVKEIKAAARENPILGAEGAVKFLERLSPALEHVDGSSGAMGNAVHRAIEQLVPIVAQAPADKKTRLDWLDRLYEALEDDERPFIESLADYWGELCADPEIASEQADQLIWPARESLKPGAGYHISSTACLSALFFAGRHDEILSLTSGDHLIWSLKEWAVKSLVAQGKKAKALRLAESARNPRYPDPWIDRACEEILLSSGMAEEAYRRYGLGLDPGGTRLARFRALAKRYPHKDKGELLRDLVDTTPGEEGKWFAAAKSAGLYDEALALARSSPCDPKTLTRAARDFAAKNPAFAVGSGLAALHWLIQGYGYDITNFDVLDAYSETVKAAENAGTLEEVRKKVRDMVEAESTSDRFVGKVLGSRLGLGK